jgi:hypothetical protein
MGQAGRPPSQFPSLEMAGSERQLRRRSCSGTDGPSAATLPPRQSRNLVIVEVAGVQCPVKIDTNSSSAQARRSVATGQFLPQQHRFAPPSRPAGYGEKMQEKKKKGLLLIIIAQLGIRWPRNNSNSHQQFLSLVDSKCQRREKRSSRIRNGLVTTFPLRRLEEANDNWIIDHGSSPTSMVVNNIKTTPSPWKLPLHPEQGTLPCHEQPSMRDTREWRVESGESGKRAPSQWT